jgi:hypothetical protein
MVGLERHGERGITPSSAVPAIADVMAFVKKYAHRTWTTGRAALQRPSIDIGQRPNEVLESVKNLWLYTKQLFEHDKEQDQEI